MVEKIVGSVMLALLGWMALTVQSTATRMAVIEARLSMMASDPYTKADAQKDREIVEGKIGALSGRVDAIDRSPNDRTGLLP